MAHKINRDAKTAAAQSETDNPLNDLYVLSPDVELTLAGRKLTVREYRFMQGMRMRAIAKPLVEALQALVEDGTAADAGIEVYFDVLGQHVDLTRELMLASIEGADADFLGALGDIDGEQLLATWWTVCSRFFWRAVVARLRDRTLAKLWRAEHVGPTSSAPSPTPATAALPSSASATPSVN